MAATGSLALPLPRAGRERARWGAVPQTSGRSVSDTEVFARLIAALALLEEFAVTYMRFCAGRVGCMLASPTVSPAFFIRCHPRAPSYSKSSPLPEDLAVRIGVVAQGPSCCRTYPPTTRSQRNAGRSPECDPGQSSAREATKELLRLLRVDQRGRRADWGAVLCRRPVSGFRMRITSVYVYGVGAA